MRLSAKLPWLRQGWQQLWPSGRQGRGDHRVMEAGNRAQPHYSRKLRRMLTRLFR